MKTQTHRERRKNVTSFAELFGRGGRRFHYQLRNTTRTRHASGIFVFVIIAAVSIYQTVSPERAIAATGDITAVRISSSAVHKGWIAEIDIEDMTTGGTYNMGFTPSTSGSAIDANATVKFNVTSPGFDTSGNATTISRVVYGTTSLRQPYPNQALADETAGAGFVTVRVALSEYIYAGDTVTVDIGAGFYQDGISSNSAVTGLNVTNGSTNTYPKPIGRWAWAPYERVKSDFLVEAVVFHRFAQDAKPLAAVTFTCTDENSNSHSITVNDMTISTREDSAGTGSAVLVYAATMPVSGFTQGDVITCNFVAYPWVGDATATLNSDLVANGGDGVAQPDERLGPFELLNDKNSTYGEPCAIVSATGQASNLTTWVYASCAAAEAAYAGDNTLAYADIGRAAQAIRGYNNTNHGHNDPGGGTIQLLAENYTAPGTAPTVTMGPQKTWLTVQPASTVPCHTPVINANGNNDLMAQKLKYTCISTLTNAGNTFRGDAAYNDILWLDRMKLNSTEGAPIRYWKTMYATRNTVDALAQGFDGYYSTVNWPPALVRGNYYTLPDTTTALSIYGLLNTVIGNKNVIPASAFTDGARQISDNSIYAFNTVLNSDNSNPEIYIHSATGTSFTKGIAIVQNIVEATLSAQPIVGIENMGGTDSINNLLFWHNTTRGQRSNVAYAADPANCSVPLPFFINWSWKYNAESNHNIIDEVRNDHGCPADGGRVGNWSMNFAVGNAGNALAVGGGPSWGQPDYWGMYTMSTPATAGFVDDRSSTSYGGAGGGGGNYRLTGSSSLRNIVPAGSAVLPYDLDGTARLDTGAGALGAYEYTASDITAPTVASFSIPATGSSLTLTGITFTATDNVSVTGYMLTESATAPGAGDAGWGATAPTQYTFATYGAKTLYAWAKDAAGNVSTSLSDTTVLTESVSAHTIGGTTTGLTGSVVLQNNGGDNLSVNSGTFTFSTALTSGAAYAVSVLTQPSGQNCTVSNGSGIVSGANVTNVLVTCSNNPALQSDSIDLSTIPAGDNNASTDAIRNGVLSVSSVSCYTFDQSSIETLGTAGVIVPEQNVTLLGGVGFRVTCTASGGTANMELVLDSHYADTARLRAYKQLDAAPGASLTDITDQITFTTRSVSGVDKTVLSYAITDGGALDADTVADSSIIDPIYIGQVLAAATVTGSEPLANTGTNVFSILLLCVTALAAGGLTLRRYARR